LGVGETTLTKYIVTIGALAGLGWVLPADRLMAQSAADTTITVRAVSSLEFEPAVISVKQGTRVRLRLVNAGVLPHNFVVVRDSSDLDRLAAAASHEGGDYVPLALKNLLIGYTTLASPGQTVEMVFVVPPPGEYTYVCLMSGHAGVMLGTLRSLR
jgi:plastocyanin